MKNIAVIICAAGASTRFGGKKKKTFTELDGRPVFLRSIDFFANRDEVKQIIVAVAPEDFEVAGLTHGATLSFMGVKLIAGGEQRYETVQNALDVVKDDIEMIAVHDAARPCLDKDWIDKVFQTASDTGAAILAAPVIDTIKQAADGIVTKTVDRANLYQVQTPQVFSAEILKKAYQNAGNLDLSNITDDSQLVEAIGQGVTIVETDNTNIKITSQADLPIAHAILKLRDKKPKKDPLGPYGEAKW